MKRRSNCPLSCTLDLLGDKWSLLIIRDALLKGKQNFGEFQNSKEGISTNILTDRLQKLISHGIFIKKRNAKNLLKFDYILTAKGKGLAPIIMQLYDWGSRNFENTEEFIWKIISLPQRQSLD